MDYKHILLCVDLGPQSLYIGHRALSLAMKFQANVTCLHTIEPPMAYTLDFAKRDHIIAKNKQIAETSLQNYLTTLSKTHKINETNCQSLILVGAPQTEILTTAHDLHCDLIIVGSHGIGGYTHLLGSTAHHVISHADADVMIVQVSALEAFIKAQPSQHYLWENQPASVPKSSLTQGGPPHGGSKIGFGENIHRGPRLVNRPSTFPYKGGHQPLSYDDKHKEKKDIDKDKGKDRNQD